MESNGIDSKYCQMLDREKLYVLSPAGQLKLVDDSDVTYQPIGWVSGRFYYKSSSKNQIIWANKADTVMSYSVESGLRQEVDSTLGSGTNYYDYVAQSISSPAIVTAKWCM